MGKQLVRSTGIVGGMTLISRVLGFLRDFAIAHAFGAGPHIDAFLVAFKIPNFMRRLFAEGAFSQAFIPILAEYKRNAAHAHVQALINRVFGTLAGILLIITLIGVLAAPFIVTLFAPGFAHSGGERYRLAVDLLRWTFPYLFLISLTAFASGILNTYGRFAIPSLAPALLNLSLIGSIGFMSWVTPPIFVLAFGVLLGGGLQLIFQLPHLKKINLMPKPIWDSRDEGVKRIIILMGPAIVGASVMQINLMVDTLFASFLPTGSVTWLYYTERLLEFPLGTFGVALSTVILPHLAETFAKKDYGHYCASIDWALTWVLIISLPATVGLVYLSFPIMMTLFQYGAFTATDALMASQSLMALGLGLSLFVSTKILVSAFYAEQNTRTPVKIAMIAMLVNVLFNALLVYPLQHVGLALASTLSAAVNALLLLGCLLKSKRYQPQMNWAPLFFKVVLSVGVMGITLWALMPEQAFWESARFGDRASELMLMVTGAILVYIVALGCLGIRRQHLTLSYKH